MTLMEAEERIIKSDADRMKFRVYKKVVEQGEDKPDHGVAALVNLLMAKVRHSRDDETKE